MVLSHVHLHWLPELTYGAGTAGVMGVALMLPLLLGACAGHDAATDQQARYKALVGRSEAELIQTLGSPTRHESVGGHEFLVYEQSDVWPGRGGGAWARLTGPGRHALTGAAFDCRATFVVVQGVVTTYGLRGNGC